MTPDLAAVLDEVTAALSATIAEERGLLDEAVCLYAGMHTMWRDRIERTLKPVTDAAGMSTPAWSAGRPARWLLTSHADIGRIGVTAAGGALAVHAVPPRDRPRRVLVLCPVELVEAFEELD